MRFLLDTHTLIWFILDAPQLSPTAKRLIEDANNDIWVSTASLWEIAIKMSLGKLDMGAPFSALVPGQLTTNRIEILPITVAHLHHVAQLPFHHRDPFDRLLIAQSQVEEVSLLSRDATFDRYNVQRIWTDTPATATRHNS
ncbi:MAG: type II toxin-antitoxin system VapC family toxin [Caldilineaceae bacterium]